MHSTESQAIKLFSVRHKNWQHHLFATNTTFNFWTQKWVPNGYECFSCSWGCCHQIFSALLHLWTRLFARRQKRQTDRQADKQTMTTQSNNTKEMTKQESSAKLTNQRVSYAFTSSPFSFHARHMLPILLSSSRVILVFYLFSTGISEQHV